MSAKPRKRAGDKESMHLTLVGWRTKGRMYEVLSDVEMPAGLQWYPGNEVNSEEELTLTLKVLDGDPMLIFARANEEDIRALGAWLTDHADSLSRVETAVVGDDWGEIVRSLEPTLDWPKWPLAWFPFCKESSETQDRLEYLAHRAYANDLVEQAVVEAGRS